MRQGRERRLEGHRVDVAAARGRGIHARKRESDGTMETNKASPRKKGSNSPERRELGTAFVDTRLAGRVSAGGGEAAGGAGRFLCLPEPCEEQPGPQPSRLGAGWLRFTSTCDTTDRERCLKCSSSCIATLEGIHHQHPCFKRGFRG